MDALEDETRRPPQAARDHIADMLEVPPDRIRFLRAADFAGYGIRVSDSRAIDTAGMSDRIQAVVMSTVGGLTLSRKLVRGAATERQLADAFRTGLPVEGKVERAVKGVAEIQETDVTGPFFAPSAPSRPLSLGAAAPRPPLSALKGPCPQTPDGLGVSGVAGGAGGATGE
jgi:hypothetical protein